MSQPNIGLLALTLEFYETLAPDLRPDRERYVREKLIPALSPHANIRFDAARFRREDVEQAVAGFERDGMDAILVVFLTYAPSLVANRALQRTCLPIIIWNTQELFAVDARYGDAELLANHGVHGTFDLCNVLNRQGTPFDYVTSHLNDDAPLGDLPERFRAAHAVARLRNARLGRLGYPFPGMGDFGMDTTHLTASLGCAFEPMPLGTFQHRVKEADPSRVTQLVAEYKEFYEVADEVAADDLAAAARAEIALRSLIEEHRLDAYSYQFLSFGADDRSETVPFVAASRLLAEGVGFGGEGDLIAAAGSSLVNWLHPPGGFSEIFTTDFAGQAVLLSHMGEANVAMARKDKPVRLVRRPAPIVPVRGNQLALAVSYEPGSATLATLTLGADQRWRIIASAVTIEDFGPFDHLVVPHSKVRVAGDVRDFLTAYAKAGGPHHLAICLGDARPELGFAARYLDADYVEI